MTFYKRFRYFFLFPLLARLPLALAYRLAAWAYRFDPELRRPLRAAAGAGLARMIPAAQDGAVRVRLLDAYQAMLGRELLDVYYYERMTRENIGRWVDCEGLELLAQPRPDGRGRILAMAHFSRPALFIVALGIHGIRLNVLTQPIDERNPHLDPVDRRFLRYKLDASLPHVLGKWVTSADNPRPLYEALKTGETVLMLFDLPVATGKPVPLPFLGHTLNLPGGLSRLAEKTGAACYYGAIEEAGWRAKISIRELPDTDAPAATAGAVAMLEGEIRRHPAQWWQWNMLDHLLEPAPVSDDVGV